MEERKLRRFREVLLLSLLVGTLTGCGGGGGDPGLVGAGSGGTGTAVLIWTPPTTNTDGSPVDLLGFRVYVGVSSGALQPIQVVGPTDTTATINNLAVGTHFFAVTAISTTGAESDFSNIEGKTIN